MSSAKRKELIATLEGAQQDFENQISDLDRAKMIEPGVVGDWTVKDIMAHIASWEERVLAWAAALSVGVKPEPAPWAGDNLTEEQVNQRIFVRNRDRSLQDVLDHWRAVHQGVIQAVGRMDDEELFERKVAWLGDSAFAEAIPGNSYEHLRHHIEDIRLWRETQVMNKK